MKVETMKRDDMTQEVAKLISAGVLLDFALRSAENQITFTSEGVTYNVTVTIARKQEGE